MLSPLPTQSPLPISVVCVVFNDPAKNIICYIHGRIFIAIALYQLLSSFVRVCIPIYTYDIGKIFLSRSLQQVVQCALYVHTAKVIIYFFFF